MPFPKTILVIDDTEDILEALELVLTNEGFKVVVSTKEHYVDEIIKGVKPIPDLILLDVLLSGQDGRMIARKLKDTEKTKHIPIIMMSAHPDVEKTVKKSGAEDFLTKPFEINVLFSKIHKFI
jgi:DNA-binding response OmpR family regulator